MKTIGNIHKVDAPIEGQSANGNFWIKQTVVLAEGDRRLAVEFFGDRRVGQLKGLKEGDLVEVNWVPVSEEYNGKWYTKITGLSIVPLQRLKVPEEELPKPILDAGTPDPDELAF